MRENIKVTYNPPNIDATEEQKVFGNALADVFTDLLDDAGLTKTMAPRNENTITTREMERPDSDVHNFYRNFVRAMNGEEEQDVTHVQLMRSMKIMEAAFESDRLGRPVDFEDFHDGRK